MQQAILHWMNDRVCGSRWPLVGVCSWAFAAGTVLECRFDLVLVIALDGFSDLAICNLSFI